MATQGTFYVDAPSLASATIIYTDVNLTTVAPDGFYSDGTIVREQVSGVLLPQTSCPSCATPCGGSIAASGQQGIYYVGIDLGTDTGAVVVTFDPYSVPDGVLAVFNSISYNGLSSPSYGWLQGSAGLPTYIGATSADCNIVSGSPHTLDEYEYNGTTFSSLGTTTTVSVLSGQMDLTVGGPGNCVMVIPKTTAAPSILDLTFIGPCSGTAFDLSVACPAALPVFEASPMAATNTAACALGITVGYYVAYVTGGAGTLGLYDLVFSDPNGEFKLTAGYYHTAVAGTTNDWFQVDANGVIVAIGPCSGGGSYSIGGCGVSNVSAAAACSDAGTNPKILYCDCPTPNVGCNLFWDAAMTSPVLELFVFASANWDMSGGGEITAYSSVQC
jgi:hypothetical protein